MCAYVIRYLEYHLENPTVPIEKPLRDDIYHLGLPQWDIDFIEKDRSQQEIYDLIAGAMSVCILIDWSLCCFVDNPVW